MTLTELIVPECTGCAMTDGAVTCTAFVDPAYQHRDGRQCWGRCDALEQWRGVRE